MHKTLIGKNNYLFLQNDSCRELEVHCNNLCLVHNCTTIERKRRDNYMLIVYPNKSFVQRRYLPDGFNAIYRPALDCYKNILKNQVVDCFDVLENKEDCYFKTDTHINMKGNYLVYQYFIQRFNELFNSDIVANEYDIKVRQCELGTLQLGIGDLLWPSNLGNQIADVESKLDDFYWCDEIEYKYCKYWIKSSGEVRIMNYELADVTDKFVGQVLSWDILSKNVLFKHNADKKYKVLIFYDSFLLSFLSVYLDMFQDVFMAKTVYNTALIDLLKPDYVVEFRVERFLY